MQEEERIRLEKQYALLSDAQIMQMINDGPRAYVEGAYALVQAEARRRRLESPEQIGNQQPVVAAEEQPAETAEEGPTFVELAVINSDRDKERVQEALDAADIAYNFLSLHVRQERDLPAALMVEQARLDDAMRSLEGLAFEASIPFW